MTSAQAATPPLIVCVEHPRHSYRFRESILARSGQDVASVASGEEAVAVVRAERPRLVIFGYHLTDMTGPELCREIRADEALRTISLLFVADRESEEHVDLCMAAGCNDVLFRPFSENELNEKIERLTSVPLRKDLRTLTRIEVAGEGEGGTFLGHTVNVSRSGMLIETSSILPHESLLRLEFYLPEDARNAVRTEARVVRADFAGSLPRYGVRFLNVREEDRDRLEGFVQRTWRDHR